MLGYVDVTMTTTAEWTALGHNRVSLMVGKYLDFAKKKRNNRSKSKVSPI